MLPLQQDVVDDGLVLERDVGDSPITNAVKLASRTAMPTDSKSASKFVQEAIDFGSY